jgi:hypothetical protein
MMLAGVGSADITPPVGVPLQGHWSTRPESQRVLRPLEVRTLALRSGATTVLLVTADLIAVPLDMTRRIRRQIADRHGLPASHALVATSHTHCGPAMLPNIGLVPDPAVVANVERQILSSVDEALSKLEPVTLGLGAGSAHFNVNRRPFPGTTAMAVNHAGVVDRRARVLRLDRTDGSPLAVAFHYSCHPTTKNGSDGSISPDYPGIARAYVERELNTRALFLPGCFGNIRPLLLNEQGGFASATPEELDAIGRTLGQTVCAAARFTRTVAEDRLAIAERDLFLPFGEMKPTAELEQMAQLTTPVGVALHAPWARRALDIARSGNKPAGEASIMQAARIGPLEIVTIPGEPAQEIGHDIEATLAGAHRVPGTPDPQLSPQPPVAPDPHEIWPVGYTNDQLGYLCTPRMYPEGGYEPNAYVVYDRPAPYHDEQRRIVDTAAALHAQLARDTDRGPDEPQGFV